MPTATKERKAQKKIFPEHIIGAVLYLSNVKLFTGDESKLHKFFESIQPKYPILEDFIFSYKGVVPTSPLLGEVFNNLILARVISVYNPDFSKYILNDSAKVNIKNNLNQLFSAEETQQLKEIGKQFKEKCSV